MWFFTKLMTLLGYKKRQVSIIIVGLDNSGKTSILNYICRITSTEKTGAASEGRSAVSSFYGFQPTPTIGFNIERIRYKNLIITAVDLSGQSRYRSLWEHYYSGVDAIVFVCDVSDRLRLVVAKDELEQMVNHPSFVKRANAQVTEKLPSNDNESTATQNGRLVPILVFANKLDRSGSMSIEDIVMGLSLNQLREDIYRWRVQPSVAITGQGVEDGFNWIAQQLSDNNEFA